jgi:selenocysteine lyase/cysteine desulfurase
MDENLSAGIVCFDVDGLKPSQVVSQLRERKIIASITPYSPSYARLTPGVYNTPQEIDRVLAAIQELA